MLYEHIMTIPDSIDAIADVNYNEYLKILGNYSRRVNTLRSQFVKKLDVIAARAPRQVTLIVDAASVQVELGSINNAAAILVKSKVAELVELAEKMLARANKILAAYS